MTQRTAAKFKTAIGPLFSGPMFVACDPEQAPWTKINSTYGISRMLILAEGPKPMPDALITGLRARDATMLANRCLRKTSKQVNP